MIYKQFSVSKLLKYTKSQYDNTQLTAEITGNYYGIKFSHARINKMFNEKGLYELRIMEEGENTFIRVGHGYESLESAKRDVLLNSVKRAEVEELDRLDEEHFFQCHPRFRTTKAA